MRVLMKRIHFDPKKGELKAEIENRDDLWHLGQLIDPGDRVKGKTLRKIKLGEKDQRTMNVIKKPVFMELAVEKSIAHFRDCPGGAGGCSERSPPYLYGRRAFDFYPYQRKMAVFPAGEAERGAGGQGSGYPDLHTGPGRGFLCVDQTAWPRYSLPAERQRPEKR
ncbi:hypothetical protein J4453_03705 [Candidatus Woesearchaeota archaeon]|nr:hypothetical protein [Candidatus Woesearchaeota archaeon]